MSARRPLLAAVAVLVLAVLGGLGGCAGVPGLPFEAIPLGTGLVVVPPDDAETTPALTVLSERTIGQLGGARVLIYGVSGRFASIENSADQQVCGPGIAALFWVDLGARVIRRWVRFGDPGAGTEPPTLTATPVYENLYAPDESGNDADLEMARPPRVVVTVSGAFTMADAGSAGRVDNAYSTGAVAFLDLYRPDPVNVLSFEGAAGDEPMALAVLSVDSQGMHTTVTGTGHFTGCADLLGFERRDPGRSVRATLAMTNGQVEDLSVLGGPPPAAELAGSR